MIYQPRLSFNLYAVLGEALVQVIELALVDFISQANKPWAYYLGAYAGYAVAATGIPGAAAELYVIGSAIDVALLHSQDGSDVKLYLDGVLAATVDTYTPDAVGTFQTATVVLSGLYQRLTIVNAPSTNGDKTSSVNWLAIGAGQVYDGAVQRTDIVSQNTLVFRLTDAETPSKANSFPVGLPTGMTLAQIQTYANGLAPLLDAATDSVIANAHVEVSLDAAFGGATLKSTANSGALNERGGLLSGQTTGVRRESLWIPAVNRAAAPGDGVFDITVDPFDALITYLINAQATFVSKTPLGYAWVGSTFRGKRSIHKR